jgi:hypothetical protein
VPRRLSFILSIAGITILTDVLLEVAAARTNSPGLAKLAAFAHRGVS